MSAEELLLWAEDYELALHSEKTDVSNQVAHKT